MKKILFSVLLFISVYLQAQESYMIVDLAYRNKFDHTNLGVGAQYKRTLYQNLKFAADVAAYLPKESNFGLDVGVNLQCHINVYKGFFVYPFIGGIMSNHTFSAEPNAQNLTDWGASFGFGSGFYIDENNFINVDVRFNLIDQDKPAWYRDYMLVRVGYGVKL